MPRPRVLFFANWFSPGFKAGGSQLAAVNLVRALRDEFDFRVVTRDRDLGDSISFPDIAAGEWIETGGFQVLYLAPGQAAYGKMREILRSTPHDLVHLNSVVSLRFGIFPLIARNGSEAGLPLVISPHGEMSLHALTQKRWRKSLYLKTAKATGVFRDVLWHAASNEEGNDLRRTWGPSGQVMVAPLLPPRISSSPTHKQKVSGKLAAVFLARIDRMKNLHLAIDWIASVQGATLDIYGPVGQPDYWAECQTRIAGSVRPEAFQYHGGVPSQEVASVLSRYDILLQPSQSENFGYTVLEALAAGCPVVISNRTPWRALDDSGIGFDIDLHTPERFQSALVYIRDQNEASHSAMRKRAQNYAINYIDTSPAKMRTHALYEAALSKHRS